MKTITLTYVQRLRITLLIKAQTGTRKDTTMRLLRDLRKRLGLSNDEINKYVRPLGTDRMLLDMESLSQQPDEDFQLTTSEARTLLEKLDAATLGTDELDDWADELADLLKSVVDETK